MAIGSSTSVYVNPPLSLIDPRGSDFIINQVRYWLSISVETFNIGIPTVPPSNH